MSKYHIEKIKCPKCSKEKEAYLWDSINTVINPEMKEKVRTGEVFEWSCPDCGYQANLNYAMLYHQMEDQVLIYYVPGNQIEAAEMMKDGTRCFAVSLGDGKWGHMDYIQRIYEYLLEDFKDILQDESGEVVIDFSWALEAWRSKNNKN